MKAFIPEVTEEDIKKEKIKARELRKTTWWKKKLSVGICYFCGKKYPPGELTMDHLVPLIRGGKTTKGNVVTACKECNNKKKYLLPFEWEEYMKKIHEDS